MTAPVSVTERRAGVRGPWAIGAAVAVAAILLLHRLAPLGAPGELSYLALTVGGAVLAAVAVVRMPVDGRRPWLLIALGVIASAIGDIIYFVSVHAFESRNIISIGDIFWILSYVSLIAGLLALLVAHRGVRIDVDALIDMAAIGTVATLAVWQYSLAPALADDTQPLIGRLVLAIYPVCDAILLMLVVRAVIDRSARGWSGLFLAAGAACWLASDFAYMLLADQPGVSVWLDSGWMLGAALLGAAVFSAAGAPVIGRANGDRAEASTGRIVLSLAPLLVPALIEVYGHSRGDANPWSLAAATFVLVALAFVRRTRLVRGGERAVRQLRSSEGFYRALSTNSSDAVVFLDGRGRLVGEPTQLANLLGYTGPSSGVAALEGVLAEDIEEARSIFTRVLQSPGATVTTELRTKRGDGSVIWLAIRAVNLLDDPDVGGIVVNLHDVTDRKRVEIELSHQALHDALTGLPNRALFRDRVEHALLGTGRHGRLTTVVHLDLDGFKTINDSLGHDAGDELLREVSHRLHSTIRSIDTVARLGSDEFAILFDDSEHLPEVEVVAESILRALGTPFLLRGEHVAVSASLGIATADSGTPASALMRNADIAMYQAKATGKGRWVVFDASMRDLALQRKTLEADLVNALENEEFRVVYQPVVELETEDVVGFEALVRWDHPGRGRILPDVFIPIAEETGLILPIGIWVLQRACETAAAWVRDYPCAEDLSIAVNVSAVQLASPTFVNDVAAALSEAGLPATRLVLEITETVLISDRAEVACRLRDLRAVGVRIAIDDFGMGYSSLSYLSDFPVDILKIDRSFVDAITEESQIPPIVRGMLDLAHTLELEIIAEGVELALQRDHLRAAHCNFAQGYLFARPLDQADAELLLVKLEDADLMLERGVAARRSPGSSRNARLRARNGELRTHVTHGERI